MPRCFKCEEEFDEDEGQLLENGKFVCDNCSQANEEGRDDRCPKCGANYPDYEDGGTCVDCGYSDS